MSKTRTIGTLAVSGSLAAAIKEKFTKGVEAK